MNPGPVEYAVGQTIGYFHRTIFHRPELRPLDVVVGVTAVVSVVVFPSLA